MDDNAAPGGDRPDDEDAAKLIPEWSVAADDQVVIGGLLILAILLLAFGWNQWRGGDDAPITAAAPLAEVVNSVVPTSVVDAQAEQNAGPAIDADNDLQPAVAAAVASIGAISASVDGDIAILEGFVGTADDSISAEVNALAVEGINSVDNRLRVLQPDVESALTRSGVQEMSVSMDGTVATVRGVVAGEAERAEALAAAGVVQGVTGVIDQLRIEVPDVSPDVMAAVEGIPAAQGRAEGSTAVLEGVVGTATDSDAAEAAALGVDGITAVDNQLRILQPDVEAALTGAGVADPEVEMTGLVATVRGVVNSVDERDAAVEAAASVAGVEEVIDELVIEQPLTETINEALALDPIRFGSNSAVILEESFPTLDAAADLLAGNADPIEIQGYTDVTGNEARNLELSQARADAVLAYLESNGVDVSVLTAVGYGETDQFAPGDTPEAYAANRRVRFEPR